ncbi:MAG: hypothetical protein IPH29_08465 [Candidatus Microthrix sp.]|nr:hypothetical protein [Candidatus Microthrix sp.]
MKAVRVIDGTPTIVDAPAPTGDGVLVDVVSASICGSDLHLIDNGLAEGPHPRPRAGRPHSGRQGGCGRTGRPVRALQ